MWLVLLYIKRNERKLTDCLKVNNKMVQTCSAIHCKVRRTKDVKMKFHRIPLDPSLREKWLKAINRLDFKPGKTAALCEQHFKEDDYELNPYGNRCLKKGAIPSIFFSSYNLECCSKHKKDNIPSTEKQELTKEESYDTQKNAGILAMNENKETGIMLSVVSSREKQELISNINNASLLRDLEDTDSEFLDDEQDKRDDEKSDGIDTDEPLSSEVEEQETNTIRDDESVDDKDIPYSPRKRSKSDPVYFGDFQESDLDSEIKRKRFWKVAQETVSKFKKLNEYYRCLLYKKEKKIEHLHEMFDYLMQEKPNADEELLVVKVVE